MPRPIRIFDTPESIYFVTNRCFQAQHLLVPRDEVNAILLGCLARSVKLYDVNVFAFVFMSNHFHLLVRTPSLNLNQFMCHFQSIVARQLNALHGRDGKFFHRRYSAERVLDRESVLGRYCYIAANPCIANLVSAPEEWPGLSSHKSKLRDEELTGRWVDRSLRRKSRGLLAEVDAEQQFTIQLAPLPQHAGMERDRMVKKLSDAVSIYLANTRMGDQKVLGAAKVVAQSPTDRPERPKKSPRPPCHCRCSKRRAAFLERRRGIVRAHRHAMEAWRVATAEGPGSTSVSGTLPRFPVGTFPPGSDRPQVYPRDPKVASG